MFGHYKVLARRYRPQRFQEVVEQTHTITAIENAIKENRLGSAYLFYGPRGVGKTTIARILAKRVNCLNPQGVEPCNECESCKEITQGNSMDVIEIDAASNRRIEDVRELRENVKFKPILGKKKVYIVDEVHMLTKESFNALLKTLEEPPEHILFILATTEINKIPETILSRCQIFTFKKVPLLKLQKYLEEIAQKEKLKVEKEALFLIAKKGDGSVRDSLSFFEQVISYCDGEITASKVRELMGSFHLDVFLDLLKRLFSETSPDELLRPVVEIFNEGGDLERFLWEFLEFLRVAILIQKGVSDRDLLGLLGEEIEKIKQVVKEIPFEKLSAVFEEIYQTRSKSYYLRIKNTFEARILMEVVLLKLYDKLHKKSLEEILHDINQLTKAIEGKDISEEALFTKELNEELKKKIPDPKTIKSKEIHSTPNEIKENSKSQENPSKSNLNFLKEDLSKPTKKKSFELETAIQNSFYGSYVNEDEVPKLPDD